MKIYSQSGYTIPLHNKPFGLRFYKMWPSEAPYWWNCQTRFYQTEKGMFAAKQEWESVNDDIYVFKKALPFHVYYDEYTNWHDVYRRDLWFGRDCENPLTKRIAQGFTFNQKQRLVDKLNKKISINDIKLFLSVNNKNNLELYKYVYMYIIDSLEYKMLGYKLMLVKNDIYTPLSKYREAVEEYKKILETELNTSILL